MWVATGALTRGWARVPQGDSAGGIAKLREGLPAGRRLEGLQAIISSFCCPEDVWWLPEQYRIRAELLLLAPGPPQVALGFLRRAVEEARARGSKALELRATTSLTRLLPMISG